MTVPSISVDVVAGDDPIDVKCHASGQKLVINDVTFHGVSDEQFQAIIDAIEMYLIRQRQRRLKERDAIAASEAQK